MAEGVWAEVEHALTTLAGEGRFSGSMVVTRGDETLLECAAGVADRASGTPVTTATRFGVASLSKMFTAATVLALVRDRRLAVGDRVVDVLPEHRRPRTMADEVTVHHLLTHTSGIGDYAEEDEDLPGYVADYAALWRDRPAYGMERPDDFLPMYADAAPVARPGEGFHYSNAGYVLLGAVVEEVAGRPFAEVAAEQVFGPVGMNATGYLRSDEAHPDVATGYLPRPDPTAPWRSNVFSVPVIGGGDGGAVTTPRDVDRFLRAVVDGSLLGDELGRQMVARHVDVSDGAWMGYGAYVRDDGFGHGGFDPGVEAMARHLPGRDLSAVVLCNGEDMVGPGLAARAGRARHSPVTSPPVLGVDGCAAGWVGGLLVDGRVELLVAATVADVVERARVRPVVVGVDIPVGLPDTGPRQADLAARRELPPGRKSSVFPAPVRDALSAASHPEANAAHRAATGKGLSVQGFHLCRRITEVDGWVRGGAGLEVLEVHPEVSFTALGADTALSKKTAAGAATRAEALRRAGIAVPEKRRGPGVGIDDVLDACAVAWTALRHARGRSRTLPGHPEVFSDGLDAAIHV